MKRIITSAVIICILLTLSFSITNAESIEDIINPEYVPGFTSTAVIFDVNGKVTGISSNLRIGVNFGEPGVVKSYSDFYTTSKRTFMNLDDETKEMVLSYVGEQELFCVLNFVDSGDGVYPDFEKMYVKIGVSSVDGGRTPLWGKDYRLYLVEDDTLSEMPISDSNNEKLSFETDKLGLYILYFNTNAYEVGFYNEYPEDGDEPFYVADNLGRYDMVEFPEVPEKDGYVFTGWKHDYWKGKYTKYSYVETSNLTAFDLWEVYASWCKEDEYSPLEVIIESEKKITKGKEDGCEIILTLSEGKFDEAIDKDVENDWKIVGSDELKVASVERIDDTTARLTLSGKSSTNYIRGEILIEFNSELYISEEDYNGSMEVHEIADIQLDEKGVKKARFISDNSIMLEKQKRSSTGGSSRPSSYTIKFNTNGGKEIGSVLVEKNEIVTEPDVPVREGFIFKGWYADAELTTEYDFTSKVTGSFTLYAAWEEDETKKIILTVGEKKAIVFGKEIANDVAPVIRNDRVMLPIRFVAEALGAEVLWSLDAPDEVKITKGDTEIVIYIGGDYALVNSEKMRLDSSAFLENDRTYLPIRFVAESLGCRVNWNDETRTVKIGTY